MSHIEQGKIKPLVAKTFPLQQIVQIQQKFQKKTLLENSF